MSDRRRTTRQRSLLKGCIYFNNKRSALDCVVRDFSATGAKLVFPDPIATPDAFDLRIPQKEQIFPASVTWRHGAEIGVVFTDVAQPLSHKAPTAG